MAGNGGETGAVALKSNLRFRPSADVFPPTRDAQFVTQKERDLLGRALFEFEAERLGDLEQILRPTPAAQGYAHRAKAQEHHGPCRWLGNGTRNRAQSQSRFG